MEASMFSESVCLVYFLHNKFCGKYTGFRIFFASFLDINFFNLKSFSSAKTKTTFQKFSTLGVNYDCTPAEGFQ